MKSEKFAEKYFRFRKFWHILNAGHIIEIFIYRKYLKEMKYLKICTVLKRKVL